MRRGWRLLMMLGLLAGLVPLLPVGVAVADDVVVGAPCLEGDFDTALAAALTNGGGTITFACGGATTITFTSVKTITAGNTVVIDGGDLITLDGADATRMFDVPAGATLELRNIAVNNGNDGSDFDDIDPGGAINVLGTLRVFDSSFDSNEGDWEGGAIDSDGGTVEVTRSTFTNNGAGGGGAIDNDPGTLTIVDSTFEGNGAFEGGAIFSDGPLEISGSTFYLNDAYDGGAILNLGMLTLTGTTFEDNEAFNVGGALILDYETATISDSEFLYNSTIDNDGGAIFIAEDNTSATITNTDFIENESGDDGGAIGMYGGTLEITGSLFEGNDASDGGALDPDGGNTTITESSFIGNYADDDGGAIDYDDPEAEDDSLTIIRSTFYDNEAYADGGALHLDGTLATIESSTISGNSTDDDDGGGIYAGDSDGEVFIYNSTITDNDADDDGSGIYQDDGSLTLRNTIIADNDGEDCDLYDSVSNGYNLDSDDTCDLDHPTDIPNGTADLNPIADNGGPTMTHLPMETSDVVGNGGQCSGTDQRLRPRPVEACEIGSVELQTAATYTLCVNYYTGRVLSPLNGQCGAGTYELDVPEVYPVTFCIDTYTGIVHVTRSCNPPRQPHLMPDAGDLLTCVNLYTSVNRRVLNESQCNAYEVPNLIPAEL